MTDDIMAVDERVTKLEVTVAQGFHDLGGRIDVLDDRIAQLNGQIDVLDGRIDVLDGRIDRLDGRIDRLDGRIDVLDGRIDRLDGRMDRFEERMDAFNEKLGLVLERLDLLSVEMRTTITAMTRESRADRRLMFAMLKDHRVRIEALETTTRDSSNSSSGV